MRDHVRRTKRSLRGLERLEQRQLLAADVRIAEFMAQNDSTILDGNGESSDWIELHNAGDQAADLAGWHLSDDPFLLDKWTFPTGAASMLNAGERLLVFASGNGTPDPSNHLHTNFSLNANRDTLHLSMPDESIVSQFGDVDNWYPPQRADISYGLDPGEPADDNQRYFTTPTPGIANNSGVRGFVKDTAFSVDRGFFSAPFTVDVTSDTPGATIVYTVDGSEPTLTNGTQVAAASDSQTPLASIAVSTTTTLRAAAFLDDFVATNVDTQSYLFPADVVQQPDAPTGFPGSWGSAPAADYGMDPQITTNPAYANEMVSALQALPSLSLVSEADRIFGAGGIYSNTNNSSLEIPISAEYILRDGSTGFQIDAGLKIAGGASRNPNNSPKHSMSLRFRSIYGDSKLDYPMFEGSPVARFNSLQLRAMYNNSWIHWDNGQRGRGTLIRDQFIRDSLIAAGHDDAGWGNYAHVYLNGLYWGVYNVHERQDASHYAAHHGGDASQYDAVNGGAVIDGTIDSFNQLKAIAEEGDWTQIQQALDVDHFIDWNIAQAYGGNADLKTNGNWRGAGGGPGNAPWRIYAWDSERVLEAVNAKPPSSITDATGMLSDLLQVPEFVVRFGDRIQKHFGDGGIFTEQPSLDRWNARVDELSDAIIAESARWGDYRRDVHPRGATPSLYQRDVHWNNEVERLRSVYFAGRPDFVVRGYRSMGVFPELEAPQWIVDGSIDRNYPIPAGSPLQFLASDGDVHYTLDGSDPRLDSGAISSTALTYSPDVTETSLIAAGANWRYHDLGIDLGTAWRQSGFDDTSWSQGPAELGYGDGDESTMVSFGGDSGNRHPTTYFRHSFTVAANPYTSLTLRIRRDDGAVAYLNGQEVFRSNMPSGEPSYSDHAILAAPDDGKDWLHVRLSPSVLNVGENVLAVEIHQTSRTSSDTSFDAHLIGNQDASTAIIIDASQQIRARTRDDEGNWSAMREVQLVVPGTPASSSNLRISEIHYNPADDGDAEFIEIMNITNGDSAEAIDLGGVQLVDGPSEPLVFGVGMTLAAGERGVLVRDLEAFQAAYPDVPSDQILGEYDGKLDNGGERIRLLDAADQVIVDVSYSDNDPWPQWADGHGGSLDLIDPFATPAGQSGKPSRWRGSVDLGGSPGMASVQPTGVRISEVLAHTDLPVKDAIELFNPTSQAVDIGGWYLSDDPDDLTKFQIPGGTTIAAGGWVSFDEGDFNTDPLDPASFALSGSRGDSVWLASAIDGTVTGLEASTFFGATFNGQSLGDLDDDTDRLVPLKNSSLGAVNGMFAIAPIVISEVQYHPSDPTAAALALDPTISASDLEYIEIYNPSDSPVELTNWRLRGDADFDFADGQQIGGGEVIVVIDFDPYDALNADRLAAFREQYSLDSNVPLLGPLSGTLGNSYGLVKLQQPDEPPIDDPTLIPRVTVDELLYDDLAPWPESADGAGDSLHRRSPSTLGTYHDSWLGVAPSPGFIEARPSVESVQINGGVPGRSEVTSISIHFDSAVDIASDALELVNVNTGESVQGILLSTSLQSGKTVAKLSFTSGDSIVASQHASVPSTLADGTYRFVIHASGVRLQSTGFSMHTDATDTFFRRFGDEDGDGTVGLEDFGALRATFLEGVGAQEYNSQLDSDRDGVITLIDFGAFRDNFG